MGNGTRILLNTGGIITDWAKQRFESVSSPLPAIANPEAAFDLLTPVNNSRHGLSVQWGMQKLKQYGLEFPGTAGSQTTFKEPGLIGFSFATAFRLNTVDVSQYVPDYRDLMPGSDHGFAITSNPTGQGPELRIGWPDESQGIYYRLGMNIIVNKWCMACGVISLNRNHKLTLSDGTVIAVSLVGYLANVAGSPLMLGASTAGSSILKGDMGFLSIWDNEFAAGDIATTTAPGIDIMTGRG